jgi:hypothetical protein
MIDRSVVLPSRNRRDTDCIVQNSVCHQEKLETEVIASKKQNKKSLKILSG